MLTKKKAFEEAENGNFTAVKIFIEEKGVPVTATNNRNQTLAHIAAKIGNLEMVEFVTRKNSSLINHRDVWYHSPVWVAVKAGALDVIKFFVETYHLSVTEINPLHFKSTALHLAAESGHLNALKYFVDEKNADINITDRNGRSPLFLAVQNERSDIIVYLVEERSADLTLVDYYSENILYTTVRTGNLTLTKYFLDDRKATLDINGGNYLGETLVHYAVFLNRFNILDYLVAEKKADINVRDKKYGMTSLHCAALRNHYDFCKYLVEHGANTSTLDAGGQTAAEKATNSTLVEYLKSVAIIPPVSRKRREAHYETNPVFYESAKKSISGHFLPAILYSLQDGADLSPLGSVAADSYVQNFLTIGNVAVRGARHRRRFGLGILSSPPTILREKIDPVAVEVVTRDIL